MRSAKRVRSIRKTRGGKRSLRRTRTRGGKRSLRRIRTRGGKRSLRRTRTRGGGKPHRFIKGGNNNKLPSVPPVSSVLPVPSVPPVSSVPPVPSGSLIPLSFGQKGYKLSTGKGTYAKFKYNEHIDAQHQLNNPRGSATAKPPQIGDTVSRTPSDGNTNPKIGHDATIAPTAYSNSKSALGPN